MTYGSPTTTPPYPVDDERPLGELFSDLAGSMQTLLHKELELAKAEVSEQASRAGKAAGIVAAAAVAGFVALLLLAWAAAWGLAESVPTWLAFLAIGLLFAVAAALLAAVGRSRLATVRPVPRQTVETLRGDFETAKVSLSRGVSS